MPLLKLQKSRVFGVDLSRPPAGKIYFPFKAAKITGFDSLF
ncbi:hypothetical protein MmTuc01_0037 [Methanosarcina mazei Tuc01]|uniref:Uncharacterized protein n=1 Tax=Methanosarcina mazei Tuc01 TaxID=1236903 RepID=M1PZR6_METMZ|nr:hypothetical protein MmTuc01_0037 [Methanosarcina mazei Tuc01]